MVLGTMVSFFNTTIDNHTVKWIGITRKIPGLTPNTYVLETKLGIIDKLDEDKNSTGCALLTNANLAMKKEL